MPHAAVFDVDGTLVDSVDLHALAWQEALNRFGHDVTFEEARSQIGKGGDQLIPVFLSEHEQNDHGREMEEWRGDLFKAKYLPLVRPFSAVPELFRRVRDAGLKVAVASSAKADELETYLEIARVRELVDVAISSDDAERSKPQPDIFQAALRKLSIKGSEAVAIGDTPYDAEAAGKAGLRTIGFLCGGFIESDLRSAGCTAVYTGPAGLLACFGASPLAVGSDEGALRSRSAASAPKEAIPSTQEIYRSSNGDRWYLIRDQSGRRLVRHEANASSGGQVTDTEVEAFLRSSGSGPEAEALRQMLRE